MLEVTSPLAPMEAQSVAEIPIGKEWQYEPKWDGFRCIAFRDGASVELQSKSEKPLTRYFPEIAAAVGALKAKSCVLDGEIVVPVGSILSFDDLLQRIHPAASRVAKLSVERPAILIVFDLLADERGHSLLKEALAVRRERLEAFAAAYFTEGGSIRLSPATQKISIAKRWFGTAGGSLDGLIAKRVDVPYSSGDRDGMCKIKPERSADCVIGGFRYGEKSKLVGSLLLGLYDKEGLLNHVGFCSGFAAVDRPALTKKLEALIQPPGFSGKAPGGPSRWSTARSAEWQPLKPNLVAEVTFDHVSGDRFRHGTGFVRWRPDKDASQCTMEQLQQRVSHSLKLLSAKISRTTSKEKL